MALWTKNKQWEKCQWQADDKAMIYGCGESVKDADTSPEGYTKIVQNYSHNIIQPDIWIGMDKPEAFGRKLLDTPYKKVFRGNYANMLVDGIPACEFPETYWIDVSKQKRASVLYNKGINCPFYWNQNTFQVAIHLALWMGFKTLAFAGIDLQGKYFDNRKLTKQQVARTELLLVEEFNWMKWFAECAKKLGITLENMSLTSRLTEII